eukprot:CAMPEP_0182427560 /NCGR_PEP_ID=MMETSP1167-20130531/18433_1 /TAXON_ID=2988 /ORGANISM="Mallomonas Sp, Strain CCMP3275" /LENGTH=188 /DNA_ID=CAMNT_0024609877 /DNA_START=96 /DNA_END=659 /DNA_ORIENTATION=-
MGGKASVESNSTDQSQQEEKKEYDEAELQLLIEERLKAAYPEWHLADPDISQADVDYASASFQIIMSGFWTAPFMERKKNPEFRHNTTTTWFYETFYEGLFTREPEIRPMFRDISMFTQGRLLVGALSISLDSIRDPEQVTKRLTALTVKHNSIGVKSRYYICFGEALFDALRQCLGLMFDEQTELAW